MEHSCSVYSQKSTLLQLKTPAASLCFVSYSFSPCIKAHLISQKPQFWGRPAEDSHSLLVRLLSYATSVWWIKKSQRQQLTPSKPVGWCPASRQAEKCHPRAVTDGAAHRSTTGTMRLRPTLAHSQRTNLQQCTRRLLRLGVRWEGGTPSKPNHVPKQLLPPKHTKSPLQHYVFWTQNKNPKTFDIMRIKQANTAWKVSVNEAHAS